MYSMQQVSHTMLHVILSSKYMCYIGMGDVYVCTQSLYILPTIMYL